MYFLEKIEDFVGREYVVNHIDNFITHNSRGYYKIVGEPGIGKTAVSASEDKTLKVWDLFTQKLFCSHQTDENDQFCCIEGENIVVGGNLGVIHSFKIENMSSVRSIIRN